LCEKAIEQHEKFLELWKKTNPGIAEVEDIIVGKLTAPVIGATKRILISASRAALKKKVKSVAN